MKLMNGQHQSTWKTAASLILCMLFLTACKNTNETNAGICNGNWGLVGADICWIGFPGEVFCVYFAKDNDRDGSYRSGTSDVCIRDWQGHQDPYDCDRLCREYDCSKTQCPARQEIKDRPTSLNTKKRSTDTNSLKVP